MYYMDFSYGNMLYDNIFKTKYVRNEKINFNQVKT